MPVIIRDKEDGRLTNLVFDQGFLASGAERLLPRFKSSQNFQRKFAVRQGSAGKLNAFQEIIYGQRQRLWLVNPLYLVFRRYLRWNGGWQRFRGLSLR